MPELAYVNGQFMPLAQATVPVEDRGFQFADSVYEVLRTYGGQPFALDEHLARLRRSLAAIALDYPTEGLRGIIAEAVRRAAFPEAVIYLQITRGVAPRHRAIPAQVRPTLVLTVRALVPHPEWQEHGIRVITVPDNRWGRCDIKSVGLLANVLAHQAARNAGAHDAIFVEADGTVNESTAGNVFIVRAGQLLTPPKSHRILAGITRDKFLAITPVTETRITAADLLGADEVFLTATTVEVVPVVMVNGKPIGSGTPGPVTRRSLELFHKNFRPAGPSRG